MARFEIYPDAAGWYRWRLVANNNQIVASSGESFSSKQSAVNAAYRIKELAPNAPVLGV